MPTAIHGHVSSERLLHFSLWLAQGLLAATFAALSLVKLLSEPERLVEVMAWTHSAPSWFVYLLAVLELIGACVVAVPAVTRTPQRIVGWTASMFGVLMGVASWLHLFHGELRLALVTLAITALCGFVTWGRLTHEPLELIER